MTEGAVTNACPENPLTGSTPSIWAWGDSLSIARSFAAGAKAFIVRLALQPGESVLDVACGTGNRAILAARAGARVCAIDTAPNLIAQARFEARMAGCIVAFDVGDAEALPYDDAQFDTTVSMFGNDVQRSAGPGCDRAASSDPSGRPPRHGVLDS
jgi:SAM-dependent methyltransferase